MLRLRTCDHIKAATGPGTLASQRTRWFSGKCAAICDM